MSITGGQYPLNQRFGFFLKASLVRLDSGEVELKLHPDETENAFEHHWFCGVCPARLEHRRMLLTGRYASSDDYARQVAKRSPCLHEIL